MFRTAKQNRRIRRNLRTIPKHYNAYPQVRRFNAPKRAKVLASQSQTSR